MTHPDSDPNDPVGNGTYVVKMKLRKPIPQFLPISGKKLRIKNNGEIINDDWIDMHFQQNLNLRSNTVQIVDRSKFKIGKNIMLNRLLILNRQIEFEPKLFQIENKTIVYGVLNNQMYKN